MPRIGYSKEEEYKVSPWLRALFAKAGVDEVDPGKWFRFMTVAYLLMTVAVLYLAWVVRENNAVLNSMAEIYANRTPGIKWEGGHFVIDDSPIIIVSDPSLVPHT